jgi:glucose-6-phosphate-specific signal transduction histidine kinase
MKNIIFYLGIGTLFTHELDAMSNHEWRVLPLAIWLPDEYGMIAFLFIHIPLFACLIALVASTNDTIRIRTKLGISIFLIVHGMLHAVYIGNAGYEFASALSNIIIFGGALLGIIYLLLDYMEKHRPST